MKFKNKKGVVIDAKTIHDINILKSNPNYTEVKEKIEEKPQKTTKEGGNKPS